MTKKCKMCSVVHKPFKAKQFTRALKKMKRKFMTTKELEEKLDLPEIHLFGDIIIDKRVEEGLPPEEFAKKYNIPLKLLEALEADNFEDIIVKDC